MMYEGCDAIVTTWDFDRNEDWKRRNEETTYYLYVAKKGDDQ